MKPILKYGLTSLLAASLVVPSMVAMAADVQIYATADYDDSQVTVEILANITDVADDNSDALLSSGVKLFYNDAELSLADLGVGVKNPTKNETVWYFGDGVSNYSYLEPNTSVTGEIVFMLGRIDSTETEQSGVKGEGVLLGTVVFSRTTSDSPADPAALFGLGVTHGHEDADGENFVQNVKFVDFADRSGADLDGAVSFAAVSYETTAIDSDGDGVADNADNCTLVANADQRDTDGDGYGNICDPDFNADNRTDFADLAQLKSVFFTTSNPDQDLNGDNRVDFEDLAILKSYFFKSPGPSGLVD